MKKSIFKTLSGFNPFLFLFIFLFLLSISVLAKKNPKHFVFFNLDRHRIKEPSFINNPNFSGAQLKYRWKELEPEKDQYNFQNIKNDLEFLTRNNKKLFIQIQDVTFDIKYINVPDYIRREKEFNGGLAIQYITDNKDKIIRQDGYVPRRWDKNVAGRFYQLLFKLGKQFDGQIEGINLPETAVGFGETGKLYPEGFTPAIYRDAILIQMQALKKAFPKSVALQYANFMPGEWLPFEDKGYLESLYKFAAENQIAMGGPDIKIYKKAQMNHSYKFLKFYSDRIKTGIAVQWGNYDEINPKTNKRVSIREIYNFGINEIGLDYIFWSTQEPFYSKDLMDFLNSLSKSNESKTPN